IRRFGCHRHGQYDLQLDRHRIPRAGDRKHDQSEGAHHHASGRAKDMNHPNAGSMVREVSGFRALVKRIAGCRLGENSGQALVMLGLMMMVLIGFVALATDTGFVWMNRRSLQNSVDAAALAGVQHLPEDAGSATAKGCEYSTVKNAVPSMYGKLGTCTSGADVEIKTTYFAQDTIKVTAYKVVHPIFGLAVGFGDIEASASATAIVGSLGSACGVPLFQTIDL